MPSKNIDDIIQTGIISPRFKEGLLNPTTRMKTISDGCGDNRFKLSPNERKVLEGLGNYEKFEDFVNELNIKNTKLGPGGEKNSLGEKKY